VTTRWYDQIIAGLITVVVSFLGSQLALFLGFYTIFVALGASYAAVWLVKKAIQNRRSPLLKYVMSGSALLASLTPLIITAIRDLQLYGYLLGGGFYSIIWKLAYAVIIAGNIFYQLKN
jgi:hypothetical protein